jgi:hypothetical protein
MSVVLATDTYATIRPVVERLRQQTVAHKLEIVFVTLSEKDFRAGMRELQEFAAVRIVEIESLVPLGESRAAGVRAATAPLVFLGETHSYPHPTWAETLIAAQAGGWAVIAPGFRNANPIGALSWAGFLSDYGVWNDGLPAGEVDYFPLNNSAFSRSALLEFGGELGAALSHGDQMVIGLRARGRRFYFEPSAQIEHLNVARLKPWMEERFVAGILIAWHRSADWSPARRLVFVCGSPLIPVVLMLRTLTGVRATLRRQRLPAATIPAMIMGSVLKASGEMIGYARWAGEASAEGRMTEYELHKISYARRPAP